MDINMKQFTLLSLVFLLVLSCGKDTEKVTQASTVSAIAFGSCGSQEREQPVLLRVVETKPDAFIYLGDNIYGDTKSIDTLRMKYQALADKPEFQKLKASTTLYATWDDHDYGWNDEGRHYVLRSETKQAYLDFFGMQGDSTLNDHEGIYHTAYLEKNGKRIQIILPDLRTFRDKLLPYNGNRKGDSRFNYEMDYSPYTTPDSTMMGEQQWQWLEAQLLMPADLRIIASSTQFGITHNGYEAWVNFPHEQKRMTDLIQKTKANGVIFLTGDVHYAEISKLKVPGMYPLYDVTASGITSTWDFATPNDNRIDGPVMENHFGLLTVDWAQPDPEITFLIFDVEGKKRISRRIRMSELTF
jgi:alkaline phosphatase D